MNVTHSYIHYSMWAFGTTESYTGEMVTETMLVQNVNDDTIGLGKVAEFIANLSPKKSYISIPIRPPAEKWVNPADERNVNRAYQIFKEQGIEAEYLIGYEGNAFAFTGNIDDDLLGIMSVHPMREDGVRELLSKANASWSVIENLLVQQKVIQTEYNGRKFYMRKLPSKTRDATEGGF